MNILFVCTGNSCRSPMAESYLNKRLKELGKEGIKASSAGIMFLTGMRATDEAITIMAEQDCDISGHQSRKLSAIDVNKADLVFVMEKRHREYILDMFPKARNKVYLLKEFKKIGDFKVSQEPDIPDPIMKGMGYYRVIFNVIKDSIERVLKEIA